MTASRFGIQVRRTLENIAIPIVAILLGLVAASAFVILAGNDPIQTYTALFCEGFGSRHCDSLGDLISVDVVNEDDGTVQHYFAPAYGQGGHPLALMLERATPMILTALAAAVAFQAGMFSIGMDGQFLLGAMAAVILGYTLPGAIYPVFGVADPDEAPMILKTVMHLVMPLICIGGAMGVGAFYSWIAGYLRVKLDVNVLISTIILNAIAVQLVGYLINYPLRADPNSTARTHAIDDTAWLIPFNRGIFADIEWFRGARVGVGLFIALLAAFAVWFFLWRTTAGYEQRMARGSRLFARFGGIPGDKAALRAMLISGALSGLAGAVQVLGVDRRVVDGFALSGIGFDGVLIAILAKESVPGILIMAPFFAGLDNGAVNLQFGNIPRQLGGIIISFIFLFSAMEEVLRSSWARVRARLRPRRAGPTAPNAPEGARA